MSLTNTEIADLLEIALKTKIRQRNNFNDNPTISTELSKKIAELEILINNISISKANLEDLLHIKNK